MGKPPRPVPPATAPTWPVAEFDTFLRRLMDAQGIKDAAELSRLSGVGEPQLSNWKRGVAQPSRRSLSKIAPVLHVKAVLLWIAAGVATEEELDITDQPRLLDAMPAEIRDLVEVADALPEMERRVLLESVRMLVDGARSRRPSRR